MEIRLPRTVLIGRDTLTLLRIPFSLFLMPVFLLALSQCGSTDPWRITFVFLIVHLLIYPASNGYNSFVDQDEGAIGGIKSPPRPTRELFWVTLSMDFAATILGLFISPLFGCCLLAYIVASRAYSSPQVRLKKRPWAGFFTVVFFQGAFMYITCWIGLTGRSPRLDFTQLFFMGAASFQIAGAYPLTQVYQHAEDGRRGDRTLSMLLGLRGTFLFSGVMFFISLCCYIAAFYNRTVLEQALLALAFIPSLAYFSWWFARVRADERWAGYDETMRMSAVASASMSLCFILLTFMQNNR
jgi:4-hydroxybenzoate polyprenyltransferase